MPAGLDALGESKPHRPRSTGALLRALLVALAALHLALRFALPDPVLFGDERNYLPLALMDAAQEAGGPWPGTLRFEHRPQLASRVFSLVLDDAASDPGMSDELAVQRAAQRLEAESAQLFRRLELLQIGFALTFAAALFALARALALSPARSAAAAGIASLFPPLAFHAHALWSELLHATFATLALAALVRAQRAASARAVVGWIVAAGLASGVCLLAKGTYVPLVPVLALLVILLPGPGRGWSGALYVAVTLAVVAPQLVANDRAGFGPRLAANRWWNLELGLTDLGEPDPERLAAALERGFDPRETRWLPVQRASRAYLAAAPGDPVRCEELAEERTRAHLAERGLVGAALDQVPKYLRVVLLPESMFAQAVTWRVRWGDARTFGTVLAWSARVAWWALLVAAMRGALAIVRRRELRAWALPLVVVAFLFAALFLVPVKARFLLPVVPLLALLAAVPGRGAETAPPETLSSAP